MFAMTRPAASPLPDPEALLDALLDAIATRVAERLAERVAPSPLPPTGEAPLASEPTWLTMAQAAAYLGLTRKTLESWRSTGEGPRGHRIGRRAVRYSREDLEAFARGRKP